MTGIEYSREENVISMSFLVSEDHKKMKEFSAATNDDERRAILGEIMDDLAETVGLTPMGPPVNFKFGLIQYTPIRYGSGTKEFDEEAIKEEISRRTKLVLVAKYDGFSYWLYRGLHGEVSLLKQRFRKERYEYPD
jgi:cystathionine beta-lyase family protein involved in aluminum resistance